jgi:SAM-dependent methyltransferase
MRLTACRSCGAAPLPVVLSLGTQPLANALISPERLEEDEPRYPLELVVCPRCSLAQINVTVPPETLFREYPYFSSYSNTMVEHARAAVIQVFERQRLGSSNLVVEIASNDGYLLQFYKERGVRVLGIDPARNVAEVAERERGIPTLAEFFGHELASRLAGEGTSADVIHAHNVLAHVADLNGFVAGLRTLLAPQGTAVIEVPYVRDMVDGCEYDTIYHEHLCYYSLTALRALFARHALTVNDVARMPIHGGSLRLFVGHVGQSPPAPSVSSLLEEEGAGGLTKVEFYEGFGRRVDALNADLRATLGGLKRQGRRLAAYGAAAKGSTLLNAAGIGTELLDYVVDRSPHKQGRLMPGNRIPIVPAERLLEDRPDAVLILAWNIASEVVAQQAEYLRRGGRFLVPIPEVRFL